MGAARELSGMSSPERLAMVDVFEPFGASEGEALFLQEEASEAAWLLAEGEVELREAVEGGAPRVLMQLKAGDLLGEFGLITGSPRTSSAVARTEVRGYRLNAEAFHARLAAGDSAAIAMIRSIASNLGCTLERHNALEVGDAEVVSPVGSPDVATPPGPASVETRASAVDLPFFRGFDPSEVEDVVGRCREWQVPRGRMVIEEGAEGDSCFVLVRGGRRGIGHSWGAPASLRRLWSREDLRRDLDPEPDPPHRLVCRAGGRRPAGAAGGRLRGHPGLQPRPGRQDPAGADPGSHQQGP